jgi:choline dehydrogenase-like flavoprotein
MGSDSVKKNPDIITCKGSGMNKRKILWWSFIILLPTSTESKQRCFGCYDYIVVGVGTAGGAAAKKLSDDKRNSVLALHNGKNFTNTPLIKFSRNALLTVASALLGPPLYENGETVPQPHADNREILWALALPEGGASSVNAGAYCRGTNQLYSRWEEIAGPLWSVNKILNTYKKLEDYHGKTTNPAARGYHGPISVRQFPEPTEVSKKFTQAIIQATGVPFVLDYNNPDTPIGASSQLQYTQFGPNGVLRESSVTAFLNKNVVTPDGFGVNGRQLRILFDAPALRTVWCKDRAVGVEFIYNGKREKAFARKGVIVCAGLKSSSFLMHSGVGPGSLLRSLGIPVLFDNPNVGKGLADQPNLPLLFSSNPQDTPFPPADPNGIFAQIAWLPYPGTQNIKRVLRFSTVNPIPGFTAALFDLCQPKSRGTIRIASPNPLDPPIINLGILTNQDDLVLYQKGLQIYIKNINQALQAIDPTYALIFPDPAILDDINLVTEYIKAAVGSNQHFQSHCRMAPLAQGGVVDSRGRVYGVKNLYVADDSVSPLDMDGSPMASAYLLGERIASFIVGAV